MKLRPIIIIAIGATVLALTGLMFLMGYWYARSALTRAVPPAVGLSAPDIWTCAMHPQIQRISPGKCPLCVMDLVRPNTVRPGNLGTRQLVLSPEAIRLAEIEVAPVQRYFPEVDVRLVGKVEYDETRLSYITARVPGRLDRLYVDYTGVPVTEGDHLVYLYSPEMLTAQQELLQAVKTAGLLRDSPDAFLRERGLETLVSAREKLRLWGLTTNQIETIERDGKPSDHLTIHAPMSGIVIHKEALEGKYVTTGSPIYTIADLSHLWIKLDAYESDLRWIHYGQEVTFASEAFPGETFSGRIAFIDPTLNPKTRTVKVRVNVANHEGRLKPEMFIRAVVRSRVAAGGRVVDDSLAGKWISPMHPEIIKDAPGTCDKCGMALVRAEELGFVPADVGDEEAPLMVPASAPLITGKRAVVYVASTNRPGLYEGREVVLGSRTRHAYIVDSGLAEGELVVVNGNFKIDSAIQIQAGTSMMNPQGGGAGAGHHHHGQEPPPPKPNAPVAPPEPLTVPDAFRSQWRQVLQDYFTLQAALAADELPGTDQATTALRQSLGVVDLTLVEATERSRIQVPLEVVGQALTNLVAAKDLKAKRVPFEPISESFLTLVQQLGTLEGKNVYLMHCPMAFKFRGARWLQSSNTLRNPYFGAEMLECGTVRETIHPAAAPQ